MTSRVLQPPTPDLVRKYVGIFEGEDALRYTDQALTWLFQQRPYNLDLADVLLKTAAVNSLYYTNIYAIHQVAEHILTCNIDDKLTAGLPKLVDDIAHIQLGGKSKHFYSFASKYCSFHRPEDHPIYDSYVERLVWAYQKQDGFAAFQRTDLQTYVRYKEIIVSFRAHYGLQEFQFKELDKFLWGYGKEVWSDVATR